MKIYDFMLSENPDFTPPSPNLIFCSGSPNYFGLKFLGPPLKIRGEEEGDGYYHDFNNILNWNLTNVIPTTLKKL